MHFTPGFGQHCATESWFTQRTTSLLVLQAAQQARNPVEHRSLPCGIGILLRIRIDDSDADMAPTPSHHGALIREMRRPARLHVRRARILDKPREHELKVVRAAAAGCRREVYVHSRVWWKDRAGGGGKERLGECGGEVGVDEGCPRCGGSR